MSLSWPGSSRPTSSPPSGPPPVGPQPGSRPSELPPAPGTSRQDRRGGWSAGAGAPRRFWRRLPLRIQLVAVTLTLVVMALAITGVAASAFLRNQLVNRVDSQLQASAAGLADAVAQQR